MNLPSSRKSKLTGPRRLLSRDIDTKLTAAERRCFSQPNCQEETLPLQMQESWAESFRDMVASHHPRWSEVFGDTVVSKSSIKQPLTYTPVNNPNTLIDYPSRKLALSEVSRHLPTDPHEKFHTTSHPGMLFHSLCWKTGEERERGQ